MNSQLKLVGTSFQIQVWEEIKEIPCGETRSYKQIAEAITSESEKNILIVGHTDSDGSDSYNQDLSERRAASVKKALVDDFGVSAARLTTKGKGETEPVTSNDTAMNKAKNRRTEFIIQ